LYWEFYYSKKQQVFIKNKDCVHADKKEAEDEVRYQLDANSQYLRHGTDDTIERYSGHILDSLEKFSKLELMKDIRIKPTKELDRKHRLIKEYMKSEVNDQYKKIDLAQIELEKSIKYMPISKEHLTIQCKDDIAQCKNYNELKAQLQKYELKRVEVSNSGRRASPSRGPKVQ
jgi:hypothetical protein